MQTELYVLFATLVYFSIIFVVVAALLLTSKFVSGAAFVGDGDVEWPEGGEDESEEELDNRLQERFRKQIIE